MEKVALDQNFKESKIFLLTPQILTMYWTLHCQGHKNEQNELKFWGAVYISQFLKCQIFLFSIGCSGHGLTATELPTYHLRKVLLSAFGNQASRKGECPYVPFLHGWNQACISAWLPEDLPWGQHALWTVPAASPVPPHKDSGFCSGNWQNHPKDCMSENTWSESCTG